MRQDSLCAVETLKRFSVTQVTKVAQGLDGVQRRACDWSGRSNTKKRGCRDEADAWFAQLVRGRAVVCVRSNSKKGIAMTQITQMTQGLHGVCAGARSFVCVRSREKGLQ